MDFFHRSVIVSLHVQAVYIILHCKIARQCSDNYCCGEIHFYWHYCTIYIQKKGGRQVVVFTFNDEIRVHSVL